MGSDFVKKVSYGRYPRAKTAPVAYPFVQSRCKVFKRLVDRVSVERSRRSFLGLGGHEKLGDLEIVGGLFVVSFLIEGAKEEL